MAGGVPGMAPAHPIGALVQALFVYGVFQFNVVIPCTVILCIRYTATYWMCLRKSVTNLRMYVMTMIKFKFVPIQFSGK
jgi:hypothetical protein